MEKYELLSFGTASALAAAAAKTWLVEVEVASYQNRSLLVAFSGGRIARQFFGAVVENVRERNLSLHHVHFFWADERCVPPDDVESNFNVANQLLLQPLGIAASNTHRIPGEIAPIEAARQAAWGLRQCALPHEGGQPVLDMIFLGMGEDGHVASLFPDLPADQINSKEPYLAVTASKPPTQRITLTYAAIAAAREVWVLASGPGKEEALQKSLMLRGQTPLARVLGTRPHTRIFSDIGAGQEPRKTGV